MKEVRAIFAQWGLQTAFMTDQNIIDLYGELTDKLKEKGIITR